MYAWVKKCHFGNFSEIGWLANPALLVQSPTLDHRIFFFSFIYQFQFIFFTYEIIVRSSAWSFGNSDPDPSSVAWLSRHFNHMCIKLTFFFSFFPLYSSKELQTFKRSKCQWNLKYAWKTDKQQRRQKKNEIWFVLEPKKSQKNLAKKPQKRNVYQKPEVENLKKQKKSETEIRSFLATATHNEPHEWVGPWLVSDTKYTTKKRYVLFYVYCIKYKLPIITM